MMGCSHILPTLPRYQRKLATHHSFIREAMHARPGEVGLPDPNQPQPKLRFHLCALNICVRLGSALLVFVYYLYRLNV
jgi:hypothetical protein